MAHPREQVKQIFQAGVAAADPYAAVMRHRDQMTPPSQIVAIGKAAVAMARAALELFPETPCAVITNYENAQDLPGAKVMAAGHPIPDQNGLAATDVVLTALRRATGPVLALISGGGSALAPAPVAGVSLSDKAALNAALLASGLDITQMNLVRQQISDMKGGGLLRAASPHPVTALILSDVIGDDLSVIASGPTVPPLGTRSAACEVLRSAEIWQDAPQAIKTHLKQDAPQVVLPEAQNRLIGSNRQSLAAMAKTVPEAHVIETPIEGDVAQAAKMICDRSRHGITLWGGETTVILRGTGRGGRNQELALRIALEAKARGWRNWTCLQGGTDGRDGPTDAAGGLVDQGTLDRIAHAGGDIKALLANNDSYAALAFADDLIITNATGTNVADLGVMIRNAD
jgi:hydroxypyruvate reductase